MIGERDLRFTIKKKIITELLGKRILEHCSCAHLSRITVQVRIAFLFIRTPAREYEHTNTFIYSARAFACIWRMELIIGTWKGSAMGSLGGEADARSRETSAPSLLSLSPPSFSLSPPFPSAYVALPSFGFARLDSLHFFPRLSIALQKSSRFLVI